MNDEEKARLVAALEREGVLEHLQPELTWQRMLAIWWFILWRSCLGFLAIFSVLDLAWRKFFGVGFSFTATATPLWPVLALGICAGFAAAWGITVIRMALIKHFKLTGVRLLLLPR